MVSRLVPRNQVQTSGLTTTVSARVVNALTGLYTVPAGRRARVTSVTMSLDAVGADATYACAISRAAVVRPIAEHVAVNALSKFDGELMLQAGDIVTNVGDAGSTNGTCDMTCTFQEYEA